MQDDEYSRAFNEDFEQSAVDEPLEQAMDEPQEQPTEDDVSPEQVQMAEQDQAQPAQPNVVPQEEAQDVAQDDDQLSAEDLAKEIQRLKSWEGRLKAKERDLSRQNTPAQEQQGELVESEAQEQPEQQDLVDDGDDESAESALEQAAEDVVDKINTEELSVDEALSMLSDDFGETFTKMITKIVESKIAERQKEVASSLDEVINAISNRDAREHFEYIADRHDDFMDIPQKPEFVAFIDQMPEQDRADSQRVIEQGTAREICKLLDAFKASEAKGRELVNAKAAQEAQAAQPKRDEIDEEAVEAAAGVRSTGMRLPTQPSATNDYEAAWNEFDTLKR